MTAENKNQNRRKFIGWGLASAAVFSAVKFMMPSRKKQTVKMLTQEGKLVEIDIAVLPSKKKMVTNKELQNWIRK
jgi:hypothetical protein